VSLLIRPQGGARTHSAPHPLRLLSRSVRSTDRRQAGSSYGAYGARHSPPHTHAPPPPRRARPGALIPPYPAAAVALLPRALGRGEAPGVSSSRCSPPPGVQPTGGSPGSGGSTAPEVHSATPPPPPSAGARGGGEQSTVAPPVRAPTLPRGRRPTGWAPRPWRRGMS